MADRKFLEIDVDNFDSRMKAMKPRAAFQVPNTLTGEGNISVELTFENMDDFSPAAIARKVDSLNKLLEARQQLANLITYMDGKSGAEDLVSKLLQDPALLQTLAATKKPGRVRPPKPWDPSGVQPWLMQNPTRCARGNRSRSGYRVRFAAQEGVQAEDRRGQRGRRACGANAGRAGARRRRKLISSDVVKSIEAIIAQLDKKLTEQINLILHHEDFQKLEGAWRGLHYLVNNTETDEMLKIRFMDISKQDLGKTLKRYKGTAWDQSPLFKKIYEAEYGQFGGEPFGCLVGDYHFDQTPPDVELLGEMSKVAAAAHAPFIAGASPDGHADGELAGAGQSARSDEDLHDARICGVAVAARV